MKIPVYNTQGVKTKEIELAPSVFDVKPKEAVVHQVYVSEMANRRQVLAHTKTRGEVRGGGKKPWKQKGTGRARHGSIRSPIWRGGGVIFGPRKDRNFKQKINKKLKRLALKMCLSDKASSQHLIVIDALKEFGPKTKNFVKLLSAFPSYGKTTLVLLAGPDEKNILRGMRNIQKVDVNPAQGINVVELLHHQYVVTTPEGIDKITEVFIDK